ncbi:MAG: AMP-binding protein [Microbacterium sp.]
MSTPRTVSSLLDLRAEERGTHPFIRFNGTDLSYADFARRTIRLANAFRGLGVEPGERVGILSGNRPEFLEAWFATTRAGAIEVPINTALRGDFLAYPIANCGAETLVVEAQYLPAVVAVIEQLPALRSIVVLDDIDPGMRSSIESSGRQVLEFAGFRDAAGGTADDVAVRLTDISVIGYTSGTTGPAKGAMLSHSAAWYAGDDARRYRGLGEDDVFSTTLPLFHLNAQHLTTIAVLEAGATLALEGRFSASGFWSQLRASGATHVNFIGAMLGILAQRPPSAEESSPHEIVAFGGPLSPEVITIGRERWNIRFLTGYGATESGIVTYHGTDGLPPGSFGRAIPEFEIDLIDDDGHPVPDGVPGEIVTRPSRAGSMMSGYYGMPEKTVEAWRDLWFHSGDMGRRDADGFFYFVDRKKDALRRRGENISSTELEAALRAFPAVAEAAVVAVPSSLGEDDVKAVVRLAPGEKFDLEAFFAWADSALPRFMVPRYVEVVEEFPRTATQRIEKYRLRDLGVTETTWDRERGSYGRETS